MIDLSTAASDDILARTIVGEARGEGHTGMIAVANVVLNRVAKPSWWGRTVKDVCLKPYQFSCWNVGDPNRSIILNLNSGFSIYNDALAIAQQVMGGMLADNTNGATHYKVKGVHAAWADGKTPCAVIGHHEFFNGIN